MRELIRIILRRCYYGFFKISDILVEIMSRVFDLLAKVGVEVPNFIFGEVEPRA